jgi:hypothetical protein
MTGRLAYSAEITSASIAKYMNLRDAGPAAAAADNIAFTYTGGANNDTMFISMDVGVAGSRSTIVAGREDFTFTANGGAGNDTITLNLTNGLKGGAQAWYTNQQLNKNIFINGGDGNDTIRKPGAGDAIIDAGTGDDTVYSDNSGALTSASASGTATAAAAAYAAATAAELAAAQAAFALSNTTGFVPVAGSNTGATVTTAAAATALDTLNLITPVSYSTAAPGAAPTYAQIQTGIDNALTAGGLTFAQAIALSQAYKTQTTLGVVTPQTTLAAQVITAGTAQVAGQISAADFAAGNALLQTIIDAANAAAATATSADANKTTNFNLLNATQLAVANAVDAQVRVFDGVVAAGTQTTVTNLAALQAALVVGATDAQVVTALQAAVANGSITGANATTLFTPFNGGGAAAIQSEIDTANLTLLTLVNNAATANATAATALATAITNNTNAINTAAGIVAAEPILAVTSAEAGDAVGQTETAAAVTNATTALTTANTAVTNANTKAADLAALKTAIVGAAAAAGATSELTVSILTANALAKGTIAAGDKTAIDAATIAVPATPAVGGFVDLTKKFNADLLITALQVTQSTVVANAVAVAANAATVVAATTAASVAASAAVNAGGVVATVAAPRAVYVFDTANQSASYNRVTQDDRNLANLKSDVDNTYNFFNSTVKVTFKGLDASVVVAGTGFKTTDLQINQAIKQAISADPVLNKLLLATDGPANSLVVTSLIDGAQVTGNLAVSVTTPTGVTSAELAGAIAAGLVAAGSTDAALITAMGVAKAAFDTKGDYVTQFAESGSGTIASTSNVVLAGANSLTSSDNTITPGTGNDVIVLSTTAQIDALSSSNETVVYAGLFGNDTIVNFAATGLGIDKLNFSGLNGSAANFGSLSADKSIVVGAATAVGATALTAAQIAALFTDSATAINHVYVAVDSNNIGSIWQVADAAGTAAGNVTATVVGSIDLSDTVWGNLSAANFV